MPPEPSNSPKNEEREDVRQTRIALTFFGGVSLAVYESGAAVEFFRLVTDREGVYRELKEEIGPVVVDIISGTSAGGLSAAFLANALINRSRSLDPLMKLWLDKADLDTLFCPESDKEPISLLSGKRFLCLIEKALREMAGTELASEPYQQYLDLFITATSLEGDIRKFELDKERIEARSHERVFQFRYRGEDPDIDKEKYNDFELQKLGLLARAARASASFPVAFEPVLITKKDFGLLSPELKDDSYHIDGGILDNKPIKLALDAIFRRQADKQIDRRLFYVEPLPEEINPVVGGGSGDATPSKAVAGGIPKRLKPINVLYAAVKDLPSYQSITSALAEIEARNRELGELRRTLDHYETLASKAEGHGGGVLEKAREFLFRPATQEMWGPGIAREKYHPAIDTPTRLFRAQEDGYLDLRLERELPSLFSECRKIGCEIQRRAEEENGEYTEAHEQFYYLKNNILWSCDFRYHQRQYHYLKQVVRSLFARLDVGERELFKDADNLRHEIFVSLNRLRTLFNKQEAAIYCMQQQAQNHEATEILPVHGLLTKLRADLEVLPSGSGKEVVALCKSAAERIAGSSEIEQRWRFLAQLHQTAQAQLKIEFLRFSDEEKLATFMGARPEKAAGAPPSKMQEKLKEQIEKVLLKRITKELGKGYRLLEAALLSFYYRDMIIYPMMRGSEMLASELQPIRVARFGPLNGESYVRVTDVTNKLAGEQGLRFGGFMDATWRGNDLIWGRLDAVENIFHQLLPKGRDHPLFRKCVEQEQRRIVKEMREKFTIGIVHPLEKQDPEGKPPHEDLLIGKQNLQDISQDKKVKWLRQAIAMLIRTIHVPGVPIWGLRRIMKWSRMGIAKFFGAVLIRPRPASLLVAGLCAVLIIAVAVAGAWLLGPYLPRQHPQVLVGRTGEIVAILWLLFVAAFFLTIAMIASVIRRKFLKIDPP